jgi:uncharacterized protein YjbJ (UPF0337 family)
VIPDFLNMAREYAVFKIAPPSGYLSTETAFHSQRRPTMNWDQVEGQWKQYKGQVKEKWGKLTDDDLSVIDGQRQQLVGRLQERYGIAREAAEEQINDFIRTLDESRIKTQKAHSAGRQ